ncbi:MAG: FMN-binding protein [Eubacteriales bacterium]
MNKLLKIFLIILAVIILLVSIFAVVFNHSEKNLENLGDIPIEDIDLSQVSDGIYEGNYKVFPISVKVNVTIRDNQISSIDLVKHINGQGGAAEVIPEMVVNVQSLKVDTIAGATYSSIVILLAIENALSKAL